MYEINIATFELIRLLLPQQNDNLLQQNGYWLIGTNEPHFLWQIDNSQ